MIGDIEDVHQHSQFDVVGDQAIEHLGQNAITIVHQVPNVDSSRTPTCRACQAMPMALACFPGRKPRCDGGVNGHTGRGSSWTR